MNRIVIKIWLKHILALKNMKHEIWNYWILNLDKHFHVIGGTKIRNGNSIFFNYEGNKYLKAKEQTTKEL